MSSVSTTSQPRARPMPGVRLRGMGFWLMACVLGLLVFASSAPSPLYGVYQQKWRFSATALTAIFGVYALALIVTLLMVGALSDYVGRRPVIVAALVVEIGAVSLFLAATGAGWLYGARVLQGCAVGAATSALSAALIDLQPEGSTRAPVVNSFVPGFGLAVGALVTSALVQYGPAPTHLIWWLLLGGFGLAIPGVLAVPESVARHPGALRSLRPRLGVPRPCLGAFIAGVPGLVALWALGGFYLSLGPSLAGSIVGSRNLLWGGVVIMLLAGVGSTSSLLFRNSAPADAVLWGALALLGGVGVTVGGIEAPSAALFLVGTAVAGVGFGVSFLGGFRILSALAAPAERARMVATIYVVCYLSLSLPAIVAGVAATHSGLHDASLGYAAFVGVLSAIAAASALARRSSNKRHAGRLGVHDLPPTPCAAPMTEIPVIDRGAPAPARPSS
ncbi:MAG: MFS transporter [Solirubrobacteraceae bacterium]